MKNMGLFKPTLWIRMISQTTANLRLFTCMTQSWRLREKDIYKNRRNYHRSSLLETKSKLLRVKLWQFKNKLKTSWTSSSTKRTKSINNHNWSRKVPILFKTNLSTWGRVQMRVYRTWKVSPGTCGANGTKKILLITKPVALVWIKEVLPHFRRFPDLLIKKAIKI